MWCNSNDEANYGADNFLISKLLDVAQETEIHEWCCQQEGNDCQQHVATGIVQQVDIIDSGE